MLKCCSYDVVCQEIPDEITLAVNISGCPNRCPGCHSPWLWEDEGEALTEELLSALMDRYASESLPDGFDLKVLDFLKLGPYKAELGALKSPSTNQALYRVMPDCTLQKIHF